MGGPREHEHCDHVQEVICVCRHMLHASQQCLNGDQQIGVWGVGIVCKKVSEMWVYASMSVS